MSLLRTLTTALSPLLSATPGVPGATADDTLASLGLTTTPATTPPSLDDTGYDPYDDSSAGGHVDGEDPGSHEEIDPDDYVHTDPAPTIAQLLEPSQTLAKTVFDTLDHAAGLPDATAPVAALADDALLSLNGLVKPLLTDGFHTPDDPNALDPVDATASALLGHAESALTPLVDSLLGQSLAEDLVSPLHAQIDYLSDSAVHVLDTVAGPDSLVGGALGSLGVHSLLDTLQGGDGTVGPLLDGLLGEASVAGPILGESGVLGQWLDTGNAVGALLSSSLSDTGAALSPVLEAATPLLGGVLGPLAPGGALPDLLPTVAAISSQAVGGAAAALTPVVAGLDALLAA